MKNTIVLFAAGLTGTIAFSIFFYRLASGVHLEKSHYYVFALVLAIMIISTVFYFKRMLDELKGVPAEDEMTVNFSRQAASRSFPYSLSMWVILLIISLYINDAVILICSGIIIMALIYGGFWLYYKFKGTDDD